MDHRIPKQDKNVSTSWLNGFTFKSDCKYNLGYQKVIQNFVLNRIAD